MNQLAKTGRTPADDARHNLIGLIVALGACNGAGLLGAWLTGTAVKTWYPTSQAPPLTPHAAVFGPVWTTLYVMMAVAMWRVWRLRHDADVRTPLALFAAQLVLNVGWSALFFYLQNPAAALVEIVVLEAAIVATAIAFLRIDAKAAALLLPYAVWVAFATYLNAGFWWLNR